MPFELGLRRIREDFDLEPVEFPSTRKLGSTPAERAADLHAAFVDPTIRALITSIGGDDQITVLPYLDHELIAAHPKPFFGYSDNTSLLTYLRNLGMVSYHGGSVMCEFGRPGAMHPVTSGSLRAALFDTGRYELPESLAYRDIDLPWEDPATFESEPPMRSCSGWTWARHPDRIVEGELWGGNLEVLSWLLMADREIHPVEAYDGMVLLLETSEEMPRAPEVFRILRSMGERGLLRQFAGILWGRAKAWSFASPNSPVQSQEYATSQREAVLAAVETYAPEAALVFDVDIGHTDPQVVLPIGGRIRIDGPARRLTVTY